MNDAKQIELLIESILKALVLDSNNVTTSMTELAGSTNVVVRVGYFDQGLVLGSNRTTLDALKRILEQVGRRSGKVVRLELLPPFPQGQSQSMRRKPWSEPFVVSVLNATVKEAFGSDATIESRELANGMTIFEVTQKACDQVRARELQADFETLFRSIGKSFNHTVHVDILCSKP